MLHLAYLVPTLTSGPAHTTPGSPADVVALAWALATAPLTGWVLTAVGSLLLSVWLRAHTLNRAKAQVFADYLEAIERQAVLAAERAGIVRNIHGYDKLMFALDYVEARLAEQGIIGDPSRVTHERLLADLEALKHHIFPGKGATVGHLIKAEH